VLRTIPERLYKRVVKAPDSDKLDEAFVLTLDAFQSISEGVTGVQAEVNDNALTKAIEFVENSEISSSRHWIDSKLVQGNKAASQSGWE
jgi:hypothetical protein